MLVGLTIEKYKGIEPSVLLSLAKRLGLEFVEITKSVFEDLDRVVPKMRRMKAGFHLPLIHDDGWDFSCPAYREEIDQLVQLINRHRKELHILHCICHPPEPFLSKVPIETSVDFLFENLRKLETPLYLENVPKLPLEDYLRLYRQAQSSLGDQLAGLCFDAAHYYLEGINPITQLENLNGEIGCVHLSDCNREQDLHLPFGQGGELPLDGILATLKKQNYDGYINLEIMPRSLDDLEPVVASYLRVLRPFRPGKYYRTRIKMFFLLPIIRKLIS